MVKVVDNRSPKKINTVLDEEGKTFVCDGGVYLLTAEIGSLSARRAVLIGVIGNSSEAQIGNLSGFNQRLKNGTCVPVDITITITESGAK